MGSEEEVISERLGAEGDFSPTPSTPAGGGLLGLARRREVLPLGRQLAPARRPGAGGLSGSRNSGRRPPPPGLKVPSGDLVSFAGRRFGTTSPGGLAVQLREASVGGRARRVSVRRRRGRRPASAPSGRPRPRWAAATPGSPTSSPKGVGLGAKPPGGARGWLAALRSQEPGGERGREEGRRPTRETTRPAYRPSRAAPGLGEQRPAGRRLVAERGGQRRWAGARADRSTPRRGRGARRALLRPAPAAVRSPQGD